MTEFHLHVREQDGREEPDVCGAAIDLINPLVSGSKGVSLAVIYVEPGKASMPHYHRITEEIYYILEGEGRVMVGKDVFKVGPGSAVYIPLEVVHQVFNDSSERMKILSADAPAYGAEDVIPTKPEVANGR